MAKEKTEQRIKKALGRDDKGHASGKHHVHGMHIRRAAGGGFIARHELADENGAPADAGAQAPEHILPDMQTAQAHMDEHMGDHPAMGEAPPPPEGGDEPEQV